MNMIDDRMYDKLVSMAYNYNGNGPHIQYIATIIEQMGLYMKLEERQQLAQQILSEIYTLYWQEWDEDMEDIYNEVNL